MADPEAASSAHSYEVLGRLAEGGQTEIFLARAKGVGAVERFVVLKRLKRAVTSHVDLVKEFLDEAQRASQLQHPNIAQVFEVGKLGGSYFFAMEFVNGETLQALMLHARTKKIQIPVRAVLTIAAAIAAGLHHAHDRNGTDGKMLGIVHGDVSPTNTLVSQEGIVKLVDFGIVKAGELGKGKVSPYASPEQCKGEPLDRRSDLFSLGIVLWELLTLDPLYQRASDDDIKVAIESEEPSKPSAKRYDVPPELDGMVLKLLAKDPADRFQDADELLASIEALAQKLTILLSTADLSRMMRLWFGTKSEPTVDPNAADPVQPFIVNSEEIPADLAQTAHTDVDDQLDTVRSAAALITARATARSGNTTGRQDKGTVPPELMDNPNENFEQIRDRILARARQKKETNQKALLGTPSPQGTALAALPLISRPADPEERAARAAAQPPLTSSDRHTRTTAQAPIAVIDEAVRRAGLADPTEIKSNGANGHATTVESPEDIAGAAAPADAEPSDEEIAAANAPDKVVVDDELSGSRSASGELGNKGTSGVISRHEAKVSISEEMAVAVPALEAPPVTDNVAMAAASGESAASSATATEQPAATASAVSGHDDASSATARDHAKSSARDHAKSSAAHDDAKSSAARDDAKSSSTRAAAASDADATDAASRLAKAARERGEDDDIEHTERLRAPVRHSTAEIMRPRQPPLRPAWLVPFVAIAALAIVFLVVMKIRGGNRSSSANAPKQTQVANDPAAVAKVAADKAAADKAAADKAAAEKAAADKAAADKAAADKAAAEAAAGSAVNDKAAADKAAADRVAADKAAADKAAADKAAADKAAADKAASDKTDKAAADKADKAAADKADKAAADKAARAEKAAAHQAAVDKAASERADRAIAAREARAEKAAADKAAADKAASDKADKAAADRAAKADKTATDKTAADKSPGSKKGIEELFAAGEFAKTNTACKKEIVFTAQKLVMCAEAACQTKETALAKRWINAISKASRPEIIEKCRSLGVDLEPAPAPAPPPAAPAPPPAAPAPTP